MSFDKMVEEFKDFADLQKYSEAQFKTIIDLNKKLQKADEENKSLRSMLEKSSPVLVSETKSVINLEVGTDQEIAASVQLRRLKETSYERELTLEEARKIEIYTKVITAMQPQKQKAIEVSAKDYSDAELAKLIEHIK